MKSKSTVVVHAILSIGGKRFLVDGDNLPEISVEIFHDGTHYAEKTYSLSISGDDVYFSEKAGVLNENE